MKKTIFIAIAALFAATAALAQVPSYVPTNGLVGWWPFNGNANDESGKGNNGSPTGITQTKDRFNQTNSAYHFNNTGTISVPQIEFHNYLNTGFTLTYWYTLEDSSGLYRHFLFSNYDGNNGLQIESSVNSQGVGLRHMLRTGTTDPDYELEYIYYGSKYSNTWKFVTFVWQKPTMSTYVNGVLVNQTSNTGISDLKSSWSTRFGSYGNGNMSHQGKLDDIGLWNRALTSTEIEKLYKGCQQDEITANPSDAKVTTTQNANFKTTAVTGSSIQWQSNAAGMGWHNVPSGSDYNGGNTSSLTVNKVQVFNHNQKFRAIAANGPCKDTSAEAKIIITDTCINTKSVSVADTLKFAVNLTGVAPPNNRNAMKVYPNPTNSAVVIDNGNFTAMANYIVKIENSIGQQVFFSKVTQQQFTVDVSTLGGKGVYTLTVLNPAGKLLETKKIVLQ